MDSDTQKTISELINNHRIVVFMKGTKNFPQCGFSRMAIDVFKKLDVEFKDVNVLADPAIRQGIKEFSNFPIIPLIYIDGKFIGGSEILQEMFTSGELQKLVSV